MSGSDWVIAVTFIVYVVAMLGIGLAAYGRTRDLADYLLGGRRLGAFVTAMSAEASDMSSWLLMGLPGYAYAKGYEASWIAIGLFVGTYLNWRLVAAPLRAATEEAGNALTISDYLEARFSDQSRLLRVVPAVFILVFFLVYTTSGLVAGGKLFNSVFGMPYGVAVVAGGVSIIIYTSLGGFTAVCWTDTVQGLLMVAALVAVPVVSLRRLGGLAEAHDAMREVSPHLLSLLRDTQGQPLTVITILSLLGWGLGYCGQPHILARFMAIRDTGALPAARRIAMVWVGVSMTAAVLVGCFGVGALSEPLTGGDTEKVFIVLAQSLFHPIPAGICLAAILAAIMSTADSQLLVCTSVITEDFYKTFYRKDAGDRELVLVGRLAVIGMAVCALLLAANPENRVLDLVAYAWAGLGASFGPTLIMSLYWKKMTRRGALAGIIAGGVTVILWKHAEGGLFELYEIIPGFAASFAAIVIASCIERRRGDGGGTAEQPGGASEPGE